MDFKEIANKAKMSSRITGTLDTETKNNVLLAIANEFEENAKKILDANKTDLENAKELVKSGEITESTYKRLKLDENKLRDMIQGVKNLIELPDPVNKVVLRRELDKGILLEKITCPIGVLGIIFEARPDVISQVSALAIKSGNAVIMKGGKEAVNTNKIIFSLIKVAVSKISEFPADALQQVFTRDDVAEMLKCDGLIDLIIPRGGNKLVQFIKSNTKIPVLGHADGICHIFVDKYADYEKALRVIIDSKTQYPSACNAV